MSENQMYIPRVSLTAAVPVEMGDSKLMVVHVGEGWEVVAADSFNRLFRPAESVDGVAPKKVDSQHPWKKKGGLESKPRPAAAAKSVESSKASKSAPVVKQEPSAEVPELGTTEAVMRAVVEAQRTQAETIDRVCQMLGWPVLEKKFRDRVYQAIWTALKDGKLQKRTDPSTQLSHLYLAGAK